MKPSPPLESLILTLRGQKVILDSDLASLYGVPTKRLNEQVKRNADRFPSDFVFQLSAEELDSLRSQIVTSNTQPADGLYDGALGSQFATLKTGRGQHRKYLPHAFTEHGALMAANAEVLKRLAEIDRTLLKHDKSLQIIWSELQPLLNSPPAPSKRQIGFQQK